MASATKSYLACLTPPDVKSDRRERKIKENSNVTGNHSDAHINGMSNGFDKKREHKSEHRDKDKERSHKSDHKDKERSKEKDRNHKSEHRDKEKDRHKHSSNSIKEKDKHDSNSSSKDKDKERKSSSSLSKDKEHKSSSSISSSSKDREKDKSKDKEHHHKSSSSSSSKDKERHHSSSKDKENKEKDKDKSKDRDKYKHSISSSSRDKDKDKNVSKDKEKERKHSLEKDKERHSASHANDKEKHRSSEKDKDKHSLSTKDKHRQDKEKDRHRHDKEKSKHKEDKDKKEKKKEEVKVKEEVMDVKPNHMVNEEFHFDVGQTLKHEVKEEPISQIEPEDDDDSGGEQPLYIKVDEDEEEPINEEEGSMDSTDGNDTRLSDLHNTTIKTEEDSDEDMPLVTTIGKRSLDSEEEDDVPLSARKKPKKNDTKTKKKKRKYDDEDEDEIEQKPKKKGVRTSKGENPSSRKKKQEEEQEVWKWWEEEKKNDGTKWTFLQHKGPVFAPPYEPLPSDIKFYYNGKEMKLSQDAEEVATFYARMLDHDYTTKPAFNKNFFDDWREVMTESERVKIVDLSKCNFKEIHSYFVQKSEERKAMTKEEKQKIKEKNEEIQKEYGFCIIDGHKEKIGNFKIEPPGLFRGRGEHPKMGKLKRRVMPEDILINCSKDSDIPKPPPGHKWKEIRHDPNVTWLASWTENIQGQVKYVMLNPSSKLKGEKDWQKYETARKLLLGNPQLIDKIRAEYREDWKSKEMRIRQRAVALYFIDKLALRAGNEKDEDQADTVGCCSLRVEHITLHEQKDGKEYVVVFDFLGKDSIRYYNEVPVEKRVFKNLQLFMENKSPSDDLFDRLNTTVMNKHLNELMEGLTAKVFRTYNASWTLQQQLNELTNPDDTEAEKILSYNRANRAAKIEAKKNAISEAELAVKDAKRDAKHGSVKEKVVYEKKKKTLDRLKEQLTKLEVQATDKEENKEIALGTSKLNYLDPRITVAWCKKHNVPIEKIYNKTQRDKFRWAIDMAGPDYVF
ncbi:DNA topoisomerase 1 [Melipona quadrifasciata]|uniref:DNA topoisomerase I n=1 Tax=Melipona quadrifasciata TaxID=166423 RepID=A0A0M9A3B6_9HYME|nr:DNA topoisomerase 1 [Melipona quadrifasciata]